MIAASKFIVFKFRYITWVNNFCVFYSNTNKVLVPYVMFSKCQTKSKTITLIDHSNAEIKKKLRSQLGFNRNDDTIPQVV